MSSYYSKRLRVLLAVLACAAFFMVVGRWARIPFYPGFEPSLALMPDAAMRTGAVVVTLVVAVVIGALIAGRVRTEAALFAGAIGLCTVSVRAGGMGYVWHHEALSGLGYRLATELALLGVSVLALWSILVALSTRRRRSPLDAPDGTEPAPTRSMAARDPAAAFAVHLLVTAAFCALFLATDEKKQAILGVGLASCLGAVAASIFVPNASIGHWLFAAPIVVGLVGYLFTGSGAAGHVGTLSMLLRAAPVDYAGAGTAGAILGRWLGYTGEADVARVMVGQKARPEPVPSGSVESA